jgi:hypothetical protein
MFHTGIRHPQADQTSTGLVTAVSALAFGNRSARTRGLVRVLDGRERDLLTVRRLPSTSA